MMLTPFSYKNLILQILTLSFIYYVGVQIKAIGENFGSDMPLVDQDLASKVNGELIQIEEVLGTYKPEDPVPLTNI